LTPIYLEDTQTLLARAVYISVYIKKGVKIYRLRGARGWGYGAYM